MLNEGYALSNSLERCGIQLVKRHPDVKEPGKKDGLIVGLDKKGRVAGIEYRKAEDVSNLWTTREGMQNSFPVLKLQRALWKVGQNDPLRKKMTRLAKDEGRKRKLLNEQIKKLNVGAGEVKWWSRLQKRVKVLRPFFETTSKEHRALPDLMDRFLNTKVEEFAGGLFKKLKQVQREIPYGLLENLLIGNKWDERKGEFCAEVPLILDVSDWDDKETYSCRVASPRLESFVSECLFKKQDSSTKKKAIGDLGLSALSGTNLHLENDKFPNPNLPIIGNTYLFAVNDQTPCQSRYKQTGTDIIPVGRTEANAIQDSLNWTTDKERHGKTWYQIPGLSDGKNDLLLVYLEGKPNLKANKAHMLGGMSKNDFSESTYEAISSVAIEAMRGEQVHSANGLIRVFALRKADPGRTQISLQRAYTISELIRANEAWREAAKNIPDVSFPFFRKEVEKAISRKEEASPSVLQFLQGKDSKAIFLRPRCPFPADLVRLTQRQWIRYGEDVSPVAGVSLGDLFDVFFATANEHRNLVDNLLSATLQRTQALLIGLGQADHKKEITQFKPDARFTVLTTVSAFAVYLNKLGIKKEEYMKDTFFQVGRFLSLIDALHLEYCKHVRGGSVPPQLLGNAHLSIALDSPVSAIDLLSRRIGIYQAWTRKEQGEDVRLARWSVGQLGKVSALLADKTLPSSTSNAERAQILLGYLAKFEESENDNK